MLPLVFENYLSLSLVFYDKWLLTCPFATVGDRHDKKGLQWSYSNAGNYTRRDVYILWIRILAFYFAKLLEVVNINTGIPSYYWIWMLSIDILFEKSRRFILRLVFKINRLLSWSHPVLMVRNEPLKPLLVVSDSYCGDGSKRHLCLKRLYMYNLDCVAAQ